MLLVKTKIGPSRINGIGLFADQFIPHGLLTWKLTHGLDIKYSPQDLERLHEIARLTFLKHAYLSTRTGLYVLCSDDARFFNHSYEPNIGDINCEDSDEGADLALRDIVPGEELTCDYRAFDTRYVSGFS